MKPPITKAPHRFTPEYYEGAEAAPVYLIKPATGRDLIDYQTLLTSQGIHMPMPMQITAAIRSGIKDRMDADEYAALNDVLDRYEANIELNEDESLLFDTACTALRLAGYAPFTQIEAARQRYTLLAPRLAAASFLVGWENVMAAETALEFKRHAGLVPDELLSQLPDKDIYSIGWAAMRLASPSKDDEKN